ncbi:hypothetical protein ACWEWX_45400, partial [Streptomyces asiaticus]
KAIWWPQAMSASTRGRRWPEGQTENHPLARLAAAARVHEVIEGPTEVLQDVVATALLRYPGATGKGRQR